MKNHPPILRLTKDFTVGAHFVKVYRVDWNNDECSSPNCVNDHYQWLEFRDREIPTCDESKVTPQEGEQVLRFSERRFAIPMSRDVLLSLMEGSRHQDDGLGDPTEGISDFCSPPGGVKIIRNSGLLFCTSIKPHDDGKRAQLRLQMRAAKPKYDAETLIGNTSTFANLLGRAVAAYSFNLSTDAGQSESITVIHGPVMYSKSSETAEFHGKYKNLPRSSKILATSGSGNIASSSISPHGIS